MQKTTHFLLNLFLAFALLAGSSIPARAAAPAQSGGDPLEPPPQRIRLWPGEALQSVQELHSKSVGETPASPAWQVPVPFTCAVYASMNATTYEFDLYAYSPQTGQYLPVFITPVDEVEPRFNHGCTRILYVQAPPSPAEEDLYLVNPDGSGQLRLTQNQGNNWYAAWSRDGTKIAFTSDRDGQPEIYTMNADGSNQVRLTYNAGDQYHNYDGMPDWSPDGSKIAFVSNRIGAYQICVMNADGSNLVDFQTHPYSFDPKWSPDGSKILYDAGTSPMSGIEFQRLCLMNWDGSNQQDIISNDLWGKTSDLDAGGWSPDGKYIYMTRVDWVFDSSRQGWYWTNSTNLISPTNYFQLLDNLTPGATDWYPSWETSDNQAPVITVSPLPAISPSPINISWTVQDTSQYKVNVIFQFKDNNGEWQSVTSDPTAASFSLDGYSGHTYSFRFATWDGFFNQTGWTDAPQLVTTVEALPPHARLVDLPAWSRGSPITLNWTGDDPGGSGIRTFDVQYRDRLAPTDWKSLLSETTLTSTLFTGILGHTYDFQIRAIDRAWNQEPWSASPLFSTMLYAARVSGALYDSSGNPIPGVTPTLSPPYYLNPPTGPDGSFASYFLVIPLNEILNWSKPGYGSQTPFYFNLSTDQKVNVYLPPANNVVANGGFESGAFSTSDWTPGGEIPPKVTSQAVHSGHAAAQLGGEPVFEDPVKIGRWGAEMAVDGSGVVHTVAANGSDQYVYTRRETNGAWSAVKVVPGVKPSTESILDLDVDKSGILYAVFTSANIISIIQLSPNGTWSPPIPYSIATSSFLKAVMEPNGRWHIVGGQTLDNDQCTFFEIIFTGGAWLPVQTIGTLSIYFSANFNLVFGGNGEVGLILLARESQSSNKAYLWYASQTGAGPWSPLEKVTQVDLTYQTGEAAISPDGVTSLIWYTNATPTSSASYAIYYTQKTRNSAWSTPVKINGDSTYTPSYPVFAVGAEGMAVVIYNFWKDNSGTPKSEDGLYLVEREPTGAWSAPMRIPGSTHSSYLLWPSMNPSLVIDANQRIHFAWTEGSTYPTSVQYLDFDRSWDDVIHLEVPGGATNLNLFKLVVGADSSVNLLWEDSTPPPVNPVTYYSRLYTLAQPASSQISQTVQVPDAASHPGLSFLYQLQITSASGEDLAVSVTGGETTTQVFSTQQPTGDWAHAWVDLTPWAGQSVTLTFRVHNDAGVAGARAYLDEISVGTTQPDAWAGAAFAYALPGSQVTVPLTFGNQGRVPASGSALTLTLPQGVTFVSASLPPSTTNPTPTWNLADLPAQSGPVTLWVTLQIAPGVASFGNLAGGFTLTVPGELETANNTAVLTITTSLPVFLPLLMK